MGVGVSPRDPVLLYFNEGVRGSHLYRPHGGSCQKKQSNLRLHPLNEGGRVVVGESGAWAMGDVGFLFSPRVG